MVGKTILHYKIIEKLGEGGMGVVYKAEDSRLDRIVAIKFLPRQFSVNERELQRFKIEAKAAAALNHPGIATIHAIEEADDKLFIVMEYIDGRELRDIVGAHRDTPLPVDEILNYAIQIAEGLQAAHDKGIIHRDIKSSNIMVVAAVRDRIKIMDFGLAKNVGAMNSSPLLTRAGTTVGTAAYMAPEQARGEEVDHRADIWAFGVVLYEMVTGKLPFTGEYEQAVFYSIVHENHPSASEVINNIPVELERIINRCLEKDKNSRYQTAAELLDDLTDVSEDLNLNSGASGRSRKKARYQRAPIPKNRFLFVSGIALLILFLIAAIPATRNAVVNLFRFGTPYPEKHLLVLPFTNIGGGRSQQAFCDGLAETLTSKLSQLEQFHGALWVVPMSEVRRNKIESPGEARKYFGVNLAVTGSLQLINDMFRLTLNLVDAKTLRQINSSILDFREGDLSELQDASVSKLLNMLNLELDSKTKNIIVAGVTQVAGAYELYLKGRGFLQGYQNIENLDKAIILFDKATEKDSAYALAYAGLGEAYLRKYSGLNDVRFIESARQASEKAFRLNDKLAPVNVTRGDIHTATGHYEKAVVNFNRALNADPTNAAAYRGLAKAYASLGRTEEAEQIYQRAINLKPDYWAGYNDLGMFYYRNSKYQKAAEQFREIIKLTPDNFQGYNKLAGMYYMMENWSEARKTFEKARALKNSFRVSSNLGTLYYIEGKYAEAARMYEAALKLNDRSFSTWGNLAAAYYWVPGKRDKAKENYWRAISMAEEQVKVNPRDADVISRLAGFYASVGEKQKGLTHLKRSLEIAPDDVRVMYRTGTTYELIGERANALKWIGKALEKGYAREEIERQPELRDFIADTRYKKLVQNLEKKPDKKK